MNHVSRHVQCLAEETGRSRENLSMYNYDSRCYIVIEKRDIEMTPERTFEVLRAPNFTFKCGRSAAASRILG